MSEAKDFPERDPEFDAQWETASKTYCLECGKVFTEHYYVSDCATERQINEDLGAATTAFLEGMAADGPQAPEGPQKEELKP